MVKVQQNKKHKWKYNPQNKALIAGRLICHCWTLINVKLRSARQKLASIVLGLFCANHFKTLWNAAAEDRIISWQGVFSIVGTERQSKLRLSLLSEWKRSLWCRFLRVGIMWFQWIRLFLTLIELSEVHFSLQCLTVMLAHRHIEMNGAVVLFGEKYINLSESLLEGNMSTDNH